MQLLSFEDFLTFGDWIGPLQGIVETLYHGPFQGHVFYLSFGSGYTGDFCEGLLKRHGIVCTPSA